MFIVSSRELFIEGLMPLKGARLQPKETAPGAAILRLCRLSSFRCFSAAAAAAVAAGCEDGASAAAGKLESVMLRLTDRQCPRLAAHKSAGSRCLLEMVRMRTSDCAKWHRRGNISSARTSSRKHSCVHMGWGSWSTDEIFNILDPDVGHVHY